MDREERTKIIKVLKDRGRLSPRESQLRRILIKDDNMYRIENCLDDNPDLRDLAYDMLEV